MKSVRRIVTPAIGVERLEDTVAEIGLDMERLADGAGIEALLELLHRRLPAALMADAEGDARLLAGLDHPLRGLDGERQRLLAEDLLAGGSGLQRQRLMQRVRHGDDDRVDLRILEHLLDIVGERDAVFAGEIVEPVGREVDARRDGDLLILGQRLDHHLAPPAEADHRCTHSSPPSLCFAAV
jgi:hypothetical protein